MLQHLAIRNIVLIESCDLPFQEGLCVLTGETGAGKSILLDALGLALGNRADSKLVRKGESIGSVTAEFDIAHSPVTREVLEELGLPASDDTLVIRRTLSADGKSRCLVNDEPVSVSGLRQIGETLIEVHGQHEQRGLLDPKNHLLLLDAYGRLEKEREKVSDAYQLWRERERELEKVRAAIAETQREEEYLRHIRDELRQLDPQPGEEESLAEKRTVMMQGEKLAQAIESAMQELSGADSGSVDGVLMGVQRGLARSNVQDAQDIFAPVVEALDRAVVEVQEARQQLEHLADATQYDAEELERIEERLFALKAASRKYDLPCERLGELLEEAESKLASLDHQHHQIGKLEFDLLQARDRYRDVAAQLGEARHGAAERLERALARELVPLKMGSTRFRVRFEELSEEQCSAMGAERAIFEVATNIGSDFASLNRIASGGELSRFMLAMKVVLAHVKSPGSYIFDEIDTGTGGAVADAIGARLALLAETAQVLVVTHLPQVAARGHSHLMITKQEGQDSTQTSVVALSAKARKEELARMLAGEEVTEEARGAAGKLLEVAAQ